MASSQANPAKHPARRSGRVRRTPGNAASRVEVARLAPQHLAIAGEIDMSNDAHLREMIKSLAPSEGDLVLDLGDLSFMDSNGAHLLVELAETREGYSSLVLTKPTSAVRLVLETLGLGKHPSIRIEE